MNEDLGFVSYLSRPASVREHARRLGRFRTARWFIRQKFLNPTVGAFASILPLTAGGADNKWPA